MHGGSSKGARENAKKRLLDAVDPLMKRLIDFAYNDAMPPAVQLLAIRDALDRAGFTPRHEVLVDARVTPWDNLLSDSDDEPVITFGDPSDEDELLDDDEPDALGAPPVRRALTGAQGEPEDRVLEGRIVRGGGYGPFDSPRPAADGTRVPGARYGRRDDTPPAHIRRALREGRIV